MRIDEVSKTGAERAQFLSQKVKIKVKASNGEEENWEYTLKELFDEFAELKKNMTMVTLFAQAMAIEFYKTKPDHPFFTDCDKKLVDFLKIKTSAGETGDMLKRVEEAINRLEIREGEFKPAGLKIADVQNVDAEALKKTVKEPEMDEMNNLLKETEGM